MSAVSDVRNFDTVPFEVRANPIDDAYVVNVGSSTVYYGTSSSVSPTSNLGSLAPGGTLAFKADRWFVGSTSSRLLIQIGYGLLSANPVDEGELIDAFTGAIIDPAVGLALKADKASLPINVKDYGAIGDGVADDTAAITSAIAAGNAVVVPSGTYRCDTVLTLSANQSLRLMKGATLKRVAAATSTDPVVRLAGNNAALLGEGTVQSEKASPRGVVNIGPTSLTASEVNINWTRIDDDITIWGVKANGNIGLCLDSTQPGGGVGFGAGSNYNGNIGGCFIRTVGTGVQVSELCAAHTFGAIRFYEINQYVYHVKGGTAGASENSYFGGFTHASAGAVVIKCERALYNEFYGVQAEPGAGSVYYNIDANSSAVKIIGRDNCPTAPTDSGTLSELLVNGALKVGGISLTSPPSVRATMSAVQAVADLTQTVILFDTEDYDNAGMHSTASNTGRLTAPVAGIYAIKCHLAFAASATGFRDIRFRLNGTTEFAWEARSAAGSGNTVLSLACDIKLAATDYVEVRAYHSQGASVNVGGSGASASFSMHRVGNAT